MTPFSLKDQNGPLQVAMATRGLSLLWPGAGSWPEKRPQTLRSGAQGVEREVPPGAVAGGSLVPSPHLT